MSAIKASLEPHADGTLHLPLPPELRHGRLDVTATVEPTQGDPRANGVADIGAKLRGFGCLAGKISMAPDFDEPLEDFKDYTE